MKFLIWAGVLVLTGCATTDNGVYRPKSTKEKAAFKRAEFDVYPTAVRTNFNAYTQTELAWAGVIRDIQFKETERTIQVAFQVEHRWFDWIDYGGTRPYRLSSEGDGDLVAGWTVRKPTSITRLKSLAKPGYMILVYGKPYRLIDGRIQLSATAVRPIPAHDYEVLIPDAEEAQTDQDTD